MDGVKVGIEKPLSFCLVKLYILTRDAPSPKLRSFCLVKLYILTRDAPSPKLRS